MLLIEHTKKDMAVKQKEKKGDTSDGQDYGQSPFFLRDSRASETRVRVLLLVQRRISLFRDPLFSLQGPSSARPKIKKKNRKGFIDRRRTGVGVREEDNSRTFFIFLSRPPRLPMYLKRTKSKIKQRLCTGLLTILACPLYYLRQ